jgi:hypothetical protein
MKKYLRVEDDLDPDADLEPAVGAEGVPPVKNFEEPERQGISIVRPRPT